MNNQKLQLARAIAAQLTRDIAEQLPSEAIQQWTIAQQTKLAAESEMKKIQWDLLIEFKQGRL